LYWQCWRRLWPPERRWLKLEHFFKADPAYGEGVAKALGIPVKELAAAR
jgi:catalase